MSYAGTMAYTGIPRPQPVSRVRCEEQRKTGYLQFDQTSVATRAEATGADIATVAAKVDPAAMKKALSNKLKVPEADVGTPPVKVRAWDQGGQQGGPPPLTDFLTFIYRQRYILK